MRIIRLTAGLLAISLYATEPRTIWRGPEVNLLGGPSADGALISYVERGELAIRDPRANTSRRLTSRAERSKEFAYFSVISPDSKQVAFAWFNTEGYYDLRVIGIDGGSPRVLYRNEEAGFVQPCAWSPDGKYLLTLLFRRDNISQIPLVPVAGGTPKILRSTGFTRRRWTFRRTADLSPMTDLPLKTRAIVRSSHSPSMAVAKTSWSADCSRSGLTMATASFTSRMAICGL